MATPRICGHNRILSRNSPWFARCPLTPRTRLPSVAGLPSAAPAATRVAQVTFQPPELRRWRHRGLWSRSSCDVGPLADAVLRSQNVAVATQLQLVTGGIMRKVIVTPVLAGVLA